MGTLWRRQPPSHACPYRPWLVAKGSLSARIQHRSGTFRVRRVRESIEPGAIFTREVVLLADDTAVVVARSTTALASLRGPWRAMLGLGNRPLADILFRDPLIQRRALQFARLDRRSPLWRLARSAAGICDSQLWARKSTFMRRRNPLVVIEVFLPAVLELA